MDRHLLVVAALCCLASPAFAERVTYSVSGSIDVIDPGVLSGGMPSGFGVGDDFFHVVSIDTSQPITLVSSSTYYTTWTAEADIFLEVGETSFEALAEAVYVVIDCAFEDPSRCDLSIERVSGVPLPFDDSSLYDVIFTATLAPVIHPTWLGHPLVPNGEPASFSITACVLGGSGCSIDYTAYGTVASVQVHEGVPAFGPGAGAVLAGLLGLIARRAAKRGRRRARPTAGSAPCAPARTPRSPGTPPRTGR